MLLLNLDREFRDLKIRAADNGLYGISGDELGKKYIKAKRGDVQSQLEIANLYLTLEDEERAFKWFLKAAAAENPEAEFAISDIIMKNKSLAIEDDDGYSSFYEDPEPWLRRAWEHGKVEAAARMAKIIVCSPFPDRDKAAYWYEASYQKGGECDHNFLANYLLEKGDNAAALPHLIKDYEETKNISSALKAADLLSQSTNEDDIKTLRRLLCDAAASKELNNCESYIHLARANEALGEHAAAYESYKRAFELTDIAFDRKTYDMLAQKLGDICFEGLGREQSYFDAVSYYEKADTLTNESSKRNFAECKYNGLGTQRSVEDAAMLGHPEALYKMAKENPEKQDLLFAAASKGYAPAQLDLGMKCYENEQYEQAILHLLPVSHEYKESVPHTLGVCFAKTGKPTEALRWFEICAAEGDPEGAYYAGMFYSMGLGTQKNEKKAFEYYKIAASGGSADGAFELGMCLRNGVGCVKDFERGMKFILAAAENKSAAAMLEMGNCKRLGYGTEQSRQEAIEYYKKSAELGFESALYQMGFLCEVGYITGQRDPEAALQWYSKCREGFKDVKKRISSCETEISRSSR